MKKPVWTNVTIRTHLGDGPFLNRWAINLTDRLWNVTKAPMYYARYSTVGHPSELRIQVQLNWSLKQFRKFFKGEDVIQVEKMGGSMPHALAYQLSRELRDRPDADVQDTLHWFYNMRGCTYGAEIRNLIEHAARLSHNLQ